MAEFFQLVGFLVCFLAVAFGCLIGGIVGFEVVMDVIVYEVRKREIHQDKPEAYAEQDER